ncbi:MAG: hypothetical protein LH618_17715, partial [Saprospiraceae bacterium]|nr:hypothetical protein [Saprospiraceae bacterium]
ALHLRQTDILAGKTYFFNEWVRVFRNLSEVKDSTAAQQLYALTVRAGLLIAVSCDSLRGLDAAVLTQSVAQYGSVSWWAVFAQDYALAEKAGLRCLALDSTQTYVWTNIGHARWLAGKPKEAKTAWLHLRGKSDGNNKAYNVVLEADWQAFEAAKVVPAGVFEAARKWLKAEW